MGLVTDGYVEIRPLVHLGRDFLSPDYDHDVLVRGDFRKGLVDPLAIHGQMDYLALEILRGLLPCDPRLYGIIPSETGGDAPDVLLQDGVFGVYIDPFGPQRPGRQCHMGSYALISLGTVPDAHDPDVGHMAQSSFMGSILWPR